MNNLTVSFIGSGRVATHLAKQLFEQGIHIKQIFSPNLARCEKLVNIVQAEPCSTLEELIPVDILFIAISDQAIAHVCSVLNQLKYSNLVVHTSGSTHIDVLKNHQLKAGVFYPLQTFSFDHKVSWKDTPILIEAIHLEAEQTLMSLANKISRQVYTYSSEQRQTLHLAAVFACNFSNYCYDIAQQLLLKEGVDHQLLLPLIMETANKLKENLAYNNQTGPARRQDINIIELQEDKLRTHPQDWLEIYQLMSKAIIKRHTI